MPPTYIALDFETADHGADSACALGLAKIRNNTIIDSWYSLIRPPRQRMLFTWVHGITWNQVKDSPTFAQLWPVISAFMNESDYLVAHNAPFDRRVLTACCASAGVPAPVQPFLCTVKGARQALRLPSHKLNAVCTHCGIALEHHHAGSDAHAAALILLYLHSVGLTDEAMLSGKRREP